MDGTNLKTLILCSDLTLNGNGNKITGVPGATKGENTLIRVLGKIYGNSTIKNLTIDGEKTYQCIYIDYARSATVENVKILNGYVKKVREIS